MNSVADMGGMDGFGPVRPEQNEPTFHAPWEGRVQALSRALGPIGLGTIDQSRAMMEAMDPIEYLTVSYYKRRYLGIERRLQAQGLVGADELAAGHSLRPGKNVRVFGPADVPGMRRGEFTRPATAPAMFAVGDRVRTRNINPKTHTRLPRYTRGKAGTIEAIRGCHVFPDTVAIGAGENPQWLYTVVFFGRELWGDDTDPTVNISIEAFEPYLIPGMSAPPPELFPALPRDDDGPVFREPWEAQSFAMVLALFERGTFTWPEWAAMLAAEIARAQAGGDPDMGDTYYRHWQSALERMVSEKRLTDAASLARYRDAWDHAADRTPHGSPIVLQPDDFDRG